jgi:hypothetical protein
MKLAFCFLTYDNIVRYDIWNYFFRDINKEKYVVYIHPKKDFFNKYDFDFKIVKNRIKTISKYDIGIVHATIAMFKEVFQNDLDITHFIFLTQNCIPLYNFNKLWNILENCDKSLLSIIKGNKIERYTNIDNRIKKYIPRNFFLKQQPNMILVRNDIEKLINNDFTLYFKNMECPDEHYFVNVLIWILKSNVKKWQTHFCNNDFSRTQALDFKIINEEFINGIKKYGFLFMRKVGMRTIIEKDSKEKVLFFLD